MKNIILVLLNTFTLIIMLLANYAASVGIFSYQSVADVSHKHDTLFAPAGYAFIIWGFLFVMMTAFATYQWILLRKGDPNQYIQRTRVWFSISNIANAAWLYVWTNEMLGWSVVIIFILLCCLIILTLKLRLELDDEPLLTIFFVWWPITFYLGWIMVASIACASAGLAFIGWQRMALHESTWAIILIITAGLLYLLLTFKRNMREAALVGTWAFVAIAIRQWSLHAGIAFTAIVASCILMMAITIHAYIHRRYSISSKIKRGEW